MATVTHKIKFIADFKVVTRQLERAAKALDTSIPGLAKFEQISRGIEAAWTATAEAIKGAAAAAKTLPKKVPTGGGGGGGGGGEGAGGGGGGAKPKPRRKLPMGLTMGGRVLAGAGGALLAQGAVAAGSALTGAVEGVAERGDAAAKSKVFSIKEFQRLSAAASLSGADIKQVEGAALKLNTTLSKGKLDPEFQRGLKALGLSAKDLKGLSPEKQLGLIGDRLNDFKDPALQAAAANKVFGDSGAQMLPFLKSGSEGLQKAGDDAERFGLVMSDQTAKDAEKLNDQISMLGMRAEGLKTRVVSAALPALLDMATGLGDMADLAGPGLAELGDLLGNVVAQGVSFLRDNVERLSATFGPFLTRLVEGMGPVLGSAFDVASTAISGIMEVLDAFLGELGLTGEGAGDAAAWLTDGLGTALDWVSGALAIVTEGAGALASMLGWIIDLLFGVSEGGNVLTDTLFAIGGAAMDIVQGGLLYMQNILTYIAELFDLFGSGEWVEGFKRLGEGILDFILEPLRMLVADIIWVADAISEDLVPDSVRAFANNTKMRELSDKHQAQQAEKAARKRLSVDDFQAKKRVEETRQVERVETQVSAKRMAALSQEGRKLSGPGLIQLGARDARGRDLAVYLGNRERRDLAAAILGAGVPMADQAAAGLRAAPALAALASPARAALGPTVGGLGASGAGGGLTIQINVPITLPPGTSATDARTLAGMVRDIARDEIATQVIRAVRQVNPGGLYQ